MEKTTEERYKAELEYCITLARKGIPSSYNVWPYLGPPYVGAVALDAHGQRIGEGYKTFLGGTHRLLHAERNAIESANIRGKPHTLITTLQPCVTCSRNQMFMSCSDLIIKEKINTVVVGSRDTTLPIDSSASLGYLIDRGVRVIEILDFEDKIFDELLKNKRSRKNGAISY